VYCRNHLRFVTLPSNGLCLSAGVQQLLLP
jgi:hypothetical protein